MSKMTPEEFLDKMDWEGGLADVFGYGLEPSDIDEDGYPAFFELVSEAHNAWQTVDRYETYILDYTVEDEETEEDCE